MQTGKKAFFVLVLFLCSFAGLHAQTRPYWYSLEQGKLFFRDGHYGNALMAFEDARRSRLDRFSQLERDFILALSTPELRAFGDSLDRVETYCTNRRLDRAAEALRELYYHFPKDLLGGSVQRALDELGRLKSYPEAEFWLGETYQAEGELGLALSQYQKAYEQRAVLETPGFDVEILYKIIGILRLQGKYQEMENRTLELLNAPDRDMLWAGESEGFTRAAMMRILENEGIARFLTLYRYNNYQVEEAHRRLGLYYYSSSRHTNAAEHLMFAFLIQNSLLIGEAMQRQFDFTFRSLDLLLEAVRKQPELQSFFEETEYFRTLYYFGASLYATGRQLPAREIWRFLAARPEAGEWQGRARTQLQSPYIERPVERP